MDTLVVLCVEGCLRLAISFPNPDAILSLLVYKISLPFAARGGGPVKNSLVLISSFQSWSTSSPGAKGLMGTDTASDELPVARLALLSKSSWFGDEVL